MKKERTLYKFAYTPGWGFSRSVIRSFHDEYGMLKFSEESDDGETRVVSSIKAPKGYSQIGVPYSAKERMIVVLEEDDEEEAMISVMKCKYDSMVKYHAWFSSAKRAFKEIYYSATDEAKDRIMDILEEMQPDIEKGGLL